MLDILEVDYTVSPNGNNVFEVYDEPYGIPVFETANLTEAVNYCYNLGSDFTVHTLAQWHRENDYV